MPSGVSPPLNASVIQRVLRNAGGNVSVAATMMGMSRATLHRKLKRLV